MEKDDARVDRLVLSLKVLENFLLYMLTHNHSNGTLVQRTWKMVLTGLCDKHIFFDILYIDKLLLYSCFFFYQISK